MTQIPSKRLPTLPEARVVREGSRDRDVLVPKHDALAIPHEVDFPDTGAIADPTVRAEVRAKRPTEDRVAILEQKNDRIVALILAEREAALSRRRQVTRLIGALATLVGAIATGFAMGRC